GTTDVQLPQFTIDHAHEMILWVRRDGTIMYVNRAASDKLGYAPSELFDKKALDLFYQFDEEQRQQIWKELREKKELEFETRIRKKDGSSIPVYSTLNHLVYGDEEIDCIFVRDWSGKKDRDRKLRLTKFTVDTASDMILWLDKEGSVVYANQVACQLLGYDKKEIQGLKFFDLLPNMTQKQFSYFWKKLRSEKKITQEYRLDKADESTIEVESKIHFIEYEGRQYGCAFLRDISERKRREKQLKGAVKKVSELSDKLKDENTLLREEIHLEHNFNNIISKSPQYKRVLKKVEQVAGTDATVMILGETGTGKELLARTIHALGRRSTLPLIKVNCAALPNSLIESELFGHEKGAFTGAHEQKKGRFELAHKGTIFLDEIGDLPLDLQVKLLRVLQEGEFERVGGVKTIRVDVRVIAATNRDLEKMVNQGSFREDLYYRLNVFPIENIPLRQRRDDIPLLVNYFLKKYSDKVGRQIKQVSKSSMKQLVQYDFPGNVRELENIVERAVILSTGDTLNLESSFSGSSSIKPERQDEIVPFEDMQRDYIIRALKKTNWRVSGPEGAARLLKLNHRTLASKMRKLGIRREDFLQK
ncbi:MAG: sigma 54-interacting transcriptional regulator, partial [Saprospiraceae bacterium]|nr:sigma 54-interacting transcriptional regulator [Saprospiraceae bacterium]